MRPGHGHQPVKLEGVFAEIRFITQTEPDKFAAYDRNGAYLLDLTQEGVDQVTSADAFRIRVERLES